MSKFGKISDVSYKASPNFSDRNKIYKCFEEGLTDEETSIRVRIKLESVKRYRPEPEPEPVPRTDSEGAVRGG